ncbi:CBS domain-containing protein [Methanosarcina thermophila]|uniref:Putative voltage-gated ClC-type chloride channel ClcB n=1 Tax=Methanosarcina thermophila CHTI-55 TaxID=1434121 RepID=A0A0E3NFA2_METTE|nr:CBS domain-containing protein [Methanosarcina thermophila]AKB15795.1 putative voltage-gated ClC-type chloride channel ClcB [Methanosarcina thermophila CHTI-55]
MADGPERDIDAESGNYADIHNREIERELSVAEVMNKAVIVIDINSDIPAIAREMVSRDAGSVIITENGQAMGIITERDLVKSIVTENRKPDEVKAEEVLSSPLVTIEPEADIIKASEIMLKANIKRLPVLKDRTVIGVISNTDILMVTPGLNTILKDLIEMNRDALLSIPPRDEIPDLKNSRINVCESCDSISIDLRYIDGRYLCENCRHEQDIEADRGRYAGIHNRDVGKVSVAQAMNKAVIVMDIDSDIPAIAREMVSRDAGSVIITENGKAMGIITERDLVKGIITENRKPDEVRAEDILSSPLITIEPEKSIAEASEIMLKANIKRLPVLEDRTVIGIISNTDILMVTPGLSTILKDLIDMNREALLSVPSIEEISESEDFPSGICESCYTFSYDLRLVNGQYLCGRCREEVGENYE